MRPGRTCTLAAMSPRRMRTNWALDAEKRKSRSLAVVRDRSMGFLAPGSGDVIACVIGIARSERSTSSAASVPVINGRSPSSRTANVPSRVSRPSFTATAGHESPVCRTTACPPRKGTQQRAEWEIEAAPTGEVAHGCRLEQALAAEARIGSTLDRAVDGELRCVQDGLNARRPARPDASASGCKVASSTFTVSPRNVAEPTMPRRSSSPDHAKTALTLSRPSSGRSFHRKDEPEITRRSIGALRAASATRLAQSRDRKSFAEALRRLRSPIRCPRPPGRAGAARFRSPPAMSRHRPSAM